MGQRLYDKNAIVTGGARGMGFAIAKALFQEGARVAVLDVDEKGAAEAAKQLDEKQDSRDRKKNRCDQEFRCPSVCPGDEEAMGKC